MDGLTATVAVTCGAMCGILIFTLLRTISVQNAARVLGIMNSLKRKLKVQAQKVPQLRATITARVFDENISDDILGQVVFDTLTERELEVFARLARGELTKQIAAAMGLAKRTIDIHRYRIMKKLELNNIAEEAVLAWRIRKRLAAFTAVQQIIAHARQLP